MGPQGEALELETGLSGGGDPQPPSVVARTLGSSQLTPSLCLREKNREREGGFGTEREKLYNQENHLGKFFSVQLIMEI